MADQETTSLYHLLRPRRDCRSTFGFTPSAYWHERVQVAPTFLSSGRRQECLPRHTARFSYQCGHQ